MHRQLANQVRRTLGIADCGSLESTLGELKQLASSALLSAEAAKLLDGLGDLLHRVGNSYEQFDRDIELRTRSLQLSSDELAQANDRLEIEGAVQRAVIEQLRMSVNEMLRAQGQPTIEGGTAGLGELAATMAAMVHERGLVQRELELQKFAMDEHAIISITDLQGRIIYANDRFCRISGYEREEWLGQNHRLINSGLHPQSFFKTMWNTILGGQVWRGEIRNRNKSGALYWVSATIVPLTGPAGQPERFIAIRTDITHRKLAEAAMEESRSFLQGIIDTVDDGLFRLDDEMQCVFINPAAERQLGVSLLELLDQPFFDAVRLLDQSLEPVDVAALIGDSDNCAFRSEDFYLCSSDGRIFPVSLALASIGRGEFDRGWVGSFRDITERKSIQDALQISERRLSVAFDAAETFLWEWNLDSGDGYTSDNFYELLGYQRGDIAFQWNTVAGLLHPDDAEAELTARQAHLRGLVDHYSVEHRLRLGSGEWRWFSSTGKVTARDKEGGPLRFTGVAYDIDDRKRAEKELADAKNEAERANQMKGQFLANMSHELRTPLNAVIGLGHLVQQTPLQPLQRDYLGKMELASQHLLGLINDILDYSKIEAGKLSIESIPLSPAEAVRDVINLLQPKARQKRLLLLFEVSHDVPAVVLGDRKRLGQILLNLTDNALKFTESGEVRVSLGGRWRDDGRFNLEFSVRDQGIGLTAEQSAKLFRPFVQADGSTARKFGGTGLGLAICRELVELMGGSIGVDSEAGVGSNFHFEFPCQPAERAREREQDSAQQTAQQQISMLGFTALVVEDDPFNQQLTQALLESWGMSVAVAGTGETALQLLRERRFDLLVQDMLLPDMNGLEIMRCVRGELEMTEMPIIALTGNTSETERALCLDAGANDFMSKPCDFDALTKMIRRLLGISDELYCAWSPSSAGDQGDGQVMPGRDELLDLLDRMAPRLAEFDPSAVDLAEQFQQLCRHSSLADDAMRFYRDMENYDFTAAAGRLTELRRRIESTADELVK